MQHPDKTSVSAALGTAMWAWTVDRAVCFDLLDTFYRAGGRTVDTATNYPIDQRAAHWRAAETLLREWIAANGVTDLQVCVKVGSINNLKTPDHLLTESFLRMNLDRYQKDFGPNLHTLMLHWDNRPDPTASYPALRAVQDAGLRVGLSGLKFPAAHARCCTEFGVEPILQTKYNLLHNGIAAYAVFGASARFMVYGINAGGLKLDGNYGANASYHARGGTTEPTELLHRLRNLREMANHRRDRPPLRSFNDFALLWAVAHPQVEQVILGTSRTEQLRESLERLARFQEMDYADVVAGLRSIRATLIK